MKKRMTVCFFALFFLVACQAPRITVVSPEEGQKFSENEGINFVATAIDFTGKVIGDDKIIWTSDVDGEIGTGANFSLDDLSIGRHKITVTATDSRNKTSSKIINISVLGPPAIKIDSVGNIGDMVASASGTSTGVGVDSEHCVVVVYINVRGRFWIKPTYLNPLTVIEADGSWTCNIRTGGEDEIATEVWAFLWNISDGDPPVMGNAPELPISLDVLHDMKTRE